MERTHILTALVALLVGAVVLSVGAYGLVYDSGVSLDQPDNQTVDLVAEWSGDTDLTADLVRDGSVVADNTTSGVDGDTAGLSLETTGIQSGDFDLEVSATDESNVSVTDTVMVTQIDAGNTTENSTLTTDVEFSSDVNSTANVSVLDADTDTELNSSTIEFDPVESTSGEGIETAEFELDQTTENTTVVIETEPVESYEAAWVSQDSDGSGIIGIIEGQDDQTLFIGVAVVALLVALVGRNL